MKSYIPIARCDHGIWSFNPGECASCNHQWETAKAEFERLAEAYRGYESRRQAEIGKRLADEMLLAGTDWLNKNG